MKLVNILHICPTIQLDIRYATSNNFMGFPIYSMPVCFLHPEVAEAVAKVHASLRKKGLGLKVFDGYRPLSVQKLMWDRIQDERFVSNPAKNKGRHTRGTAIDVTLVSAKGEELVMPTEFDDFTENASIHSMSATAEAISNRSLLINEMMKQHLHPIASEWWHYDFEGWNNDAKFPPLDVSFEALSSI